MILYRIKNIVFLKMREPSTEKKNRGDQGYKSETGASHSHKMNNNKLSFQMYKLPVSSCTPYLEQYHQLNQ